MQSHRGKWWESTGNKWVFNFSYFLKFLFIYLAGLLLLFRLSLAGVSGGLLSGCGTQASHCGAFPCYGAWAQAFRIQEFRLAGSVVIAPGPRALAQLLWHTGTVAPRHVASFQPRDWTLVSCTGRRILYHWATREAQFQLFLKLSGKCLIYSA